MVDNYKFFIGHSIAWDGNEVSFKGNIYTFYIWDEALSADQVVMSYNLCMIVD